VNATSRPKQRAAPDLIQPLADLSAQNLQTRRPGFTPYAFFVAFVIIFTETGGQEKEHFASSSRLSAPLEISCSITRFLLPLTAVEGYGKLW
jgi:hypothetical protein